ncbi:MAG: sialate O-acetylesterase [Bacteroidales bacterium]|nr:sialate O-acetylesterase [Bacteroidales bacterium]MCF8389492.1 sialate O-acetylesterase [Bacteroidales bacterium]
MKTNNPWVIIPALIFYILLSSCNSKNESEKMDVYLLIGQSNMAGRAEIRDQDKDSLKNVFLFTGDSLRLWEPAANPLNKYSSIRKDLSMQKLGPGYSFAKKMAEQFPEKKIGLVVNAKGGTSIKLWLPGTEFYDEAVKRTKIAMDYGELKGILWHQGSSDSNRTEAYPDELTLLISSLRKDFNNPELPFVVSELSLDKPHKADFNRMISLIPSQIEYTACVRTENLKTIDGTHFDSEGQTILGERFAVEMITLLTKENKLIK